MRPGDRLVTALIGEHKVGEVFRDWLLHVTIVAWFRSELSSGELAIILGRELQDEAPFMAEVGEQTRLGYRGRALVNLIVLPSSFTRVQEKVVAGLVGEGADLITGSGTWGEGYRPHITVQKQGSVLQGDRFLCDRLYIISQQGDHKKIDAEILLHG